jgi:vacuolar iron transporter family protein
MPKTFIGKAIRYPQPEAPLMDPQEPVVTEIVVDIPGWQSVKPRIPDTLQRRRLEEQRSVREIVFGAQDGILTTLGIITGVGVAEGARSAVFISGFLAMLAGALSMAVGEYLGGRSEREVVQATIAMEKAEMAADPQGEFAEQVAYYKMKGFSAEEAQMIVRRLTQHPDIYLYEMMRDEFGIDPRVAEDTDLRAPIAMGGSFAAGSLIPIIAYIVPLSMTGSTILALVLAVLSLFGVGYYAARNTDRNPVSKGLEIVAFGVVVFVLSYLAGHYIPPLFGHAPVAVGG